MSRLEPDGRSMMCQIGPAATLVDLRVLVPETSEEAQNVSQNRTCVTLMDIPEEQCFLVGGLNILRFLVCSVCSAAADTVCLEFGPARPFQSTLSVGTFQGLGKEQGFEEKNPSSPG
eukprot:scpid18236/ scgid20863/ 